MRVFVSNITAQNHILTYRLPETTNSRAQPIPPGQQIAIVGDLSKPDVDSFMEQIRRYGGVNVDDLNEVEDKYIITFLVAVDKPIEAGLVMDVHRHNQGILTFRGKRMREEAAVATSQALNERTPHAAGTLQMSVETEKGADLEGAIQEGVKVRNDAPEGDTSRGRRGVRRS